MKVSVLAVLFLLAASTACADSPHACRNLWSAPSPNLLDACHHTTGAAFSTCDCSRAYSSPHTLGYGRTGACQGYQPCCLAPHVATGPYLWAPAYCNGEAGMPGRYGTYRCGGPAGVDIGYEHYAGPGAGSAAEFAEWEHLGQIPNDLAAAGGTGGAAGRSALPGLNSAAPTLGL